jgi:hypothetical protein
VRKLWREIDLVRRRDSLAVPDLDSFEHRVGKEDGVYLHLVEYRDDHALLLEDESGQEMHRIHVVLPALNSELVSLRMASFGFGGEVVEWLHSRRALSFSLSS